MFVVPFAMFVNRSFSVLKTSSITSAKIPDINGVKVIKPVFHAPIINPCILLTTGAILGIAKMVDSPMPTCATTPIVNAPASCEIIRKLSLKDVTIPDARLVIPANIPPKMSVKFRSNLNKAVSIEASALVKSLVPFSAAAPNSCSRIFVTFGKTSSDKSEPFATN
ncbi:hypothetical protein [uncultured phage]|nr:hypothetical protein [uncultured phage]